MMQQVLSLFWTLDNPGMECVRDGNGVSLWTCGRSCQIFKIKCTSGLARPLPSLKSRYDDISRAITAANILKVDVGTGSIPGVSRT